MEQINKLMEYLAVNDCKNVELILNDLSIDDESQATVKFFTVDDMDNYDHIVSCRMRWGDWALTMDELLLRCKAVLAPKSVQIVAEEASRLMNLVNMNDDETRHQAQALLECIMLHSNAAIERLKALEKVKAMDAEDVKL